MAREAARLLEGSNWLPEPLRQADANPVSADDQDAAEINEEATELSAYLAEDADAAPRTSLRRLNSANPNPNDQKSPAATPGYFYRGRTNVGRPYDNARPAGVIRYFTHAHAQASRSAQRRARMNGGGRRRASGDVA